MTLLPSARAARATLDRSLRYDPMSMRTPDPKPVRPVRWLLATAFKLAAVATLPAVFVRVAIELHSRGFGTTATVVGAGAVVLVTFAVLAAALSHRLTGRARFGIILRWVALPAVVLWVGYSLLHLKQANAKTAEVRSAYGSLHPALRLAISSAVIADGALVVTDARRTADDYRRMGLPVFERTMHYPQPDSWVHAIDVRTIGHSEARNAALAWYFRGVGLTVVRHVGTADHLHVQLPRVIGK
jgi:hypothetical protein